ncbi:phosphopantothenate/pantothenate synthetase [Halobacteriales archaeon SW_5_70_135]|nr:MAG: phosphopantothenate/pantothenate synthetase [Halobacteriales archaeon SW_5_70_135]
MSEEPDDDPSTPTAAEGSVPESHPRHDSLVARDRLVEGVETGITSVHGLIAHGRGEAFDYLLGERTVDSADRAARAGAASLLAADRPVVSVNGNVAALAPGAVVELAAAVDAAVEVNLFHRSEERVRAVADRLRDHGAEEVLGVDADARVPGLDHDRARVDADGIATADVVLVPLEDGDRAAALDAAGKSEVVIDLNPLSRSARVADVPVVDELSRALRNLTAHAESLADRPSAEVEAIVEEFDPAAALAAAERAMREGGDGPADDHAD